MKKVFVVLLAGGMILGFGSALMAASAVSHVNVQVAAIDALSIGGTEGTIVLDQVNGDNLTSSTNNASTNLNYTHNYSHDRKITAQVTNITGGATQDITLTVGVQDGAGTKTIVNGGTPAAAQDVYAAIPAGAITNKTITYAASAHASLTLASTYTFEVTYTSTD